MPATLLPTRVAASRQARSFSQLIPQCSLDPKLLPKRCGFCAVAAQQLRSPQLVALEKFVKKCGHEFCYSCGAEYRDSQQTCQCAFWDEDRSEDLISYSA